MIGLPSTSFSLLHCFSASNYWVILFTLGWFFTVHIFFTTKIIRWKFIFFFLTLLCFSSWGFYYDLDGIVFLFLLTEFVLLFVFYFSNTQVSYRSSNTPRHSLSNNYTFLICVVIGIVCLGGLSTEFNNNSWQLLHTSYYTSVFVIHSSDFFFFFLFFFLQPLLTACLVVTLGVFSIFFIFFYFFLKSLELNNQKRLTNYVFLRRQSFLRQALFNPFLHTFS